MAAAEQKKSYAIIKAFKGLNTKANRTAIDKEEFSWLENAQPIGSGNIRITASQNNLTFASNSSANIVTNANVSSFYSTNINLTDYLLAFENDGRAEYVSIIGSGANVGQGNTAGNVAVAGTFSNAGVSYAQYKNQYAILGDPSKGLFAWDGTNLNPVGSVGTIGITNPGAGYTEAPNVVIQAAPAGGVNATAVATVTTGAGGVASVTINSGGSGYTTLPSVTFSPPTTAGGITAQGVASVSVGAVSAVSITNPGSGYISPPSVSFSGSGGASATAVLVLGSVNSITLTNAGAGYTSPPTVYITGGGANVTTTAVAITSLITFATGTVAILVTSGGSGYTSAPAVTITGSGTNAAGTAILSGGSVTQVVMTNPGTGYTANTTMSFGAAPMGGTTATGIAITNTDPIVDVATFSGRTWIAQGRTVYYSASTSPFDFTSVSAGSLTLTDETLHGNITALYSANNFLYIFGDDSINVFSDVRVTSTGATLFTNTNVSASVGSKRPYAIFPYFRSLLFMNDYGIYALVGSTTSKISDPLDGIFPYIDFSQPVTGGQVLLNNILCAAFNFYVNSSFPLGPAPSRYIQAVFFEKKWFITSQGNGINYVTSVPVGGVVSLYGVATTTLYRLYNNPTANVASYIQTALDPMGDSIRTKQALKFGIEATVANAATFVVTVDSESGSSPPYTLSNSVIWVNRSGATIPWINNSSVVIDWTTQSGYFLYKTDAQQYGKYLGLTQTSNSAGFVVNTYEFEHELRVRF
jgi:hypothetical protein